MALDFENLTPKQSVALAFGGLVLISGAVFGAQIVKERHAAKMLEIKIADNAKDASICIDKKAVTDVCDRVDKDLLDGDLLVAFENISVKRQQLLDKAEADRKAALARMEAEERARKARVAAQNVAAVGYTFASIRMLFILEIDQCLGIRSNCRPLLCGVAGWLFSSECPTRSTFSE